MKKKINIQFLIITLLAILTTVSLSIFVFYELFMQEVMADLKTNTQLLVETDAWEQIVEKKDAGALDDGVKQLRLTLVDGTGEVILDTNAEVGSMDNHSARPEISQALQTGEGQAIRQCFREHSAGNRNFMRTVVCIVYDPLTFPDGEHY